MFVAALVMAMISAFGSSNGLEVNPSVLFPDLYATKEVYKNIVVSDRMSWNASGSLWRWHWSDSLTASEVQQLESLKVLFEGFSLQPCSPDTWRWALSTNSMFSVKSYYLLLLDSRLTEEVDENLLSALIKLWKTDIPSKVNVFE
jgi:hypothetical protein